MWGVYEWGCLGGVYGVGGLWGAQWGGVMCGLWGGGGPLARSPPTKPGLRGYQDGRQGTKMAAMGPKWPPGDLLANQATRLAST